MGTSKKLLLSAAVLAFLTGISILLYPMVHGAMEDHRLQSQAASFIARLPAPEEEQMPETELAEPLPREHAELYEAMIRYNEEIFGEHQKDLSDPRAYEQPSFILENFGLTEEVFGVITIEKLDLELPIYLGATADHMVAGAAHLSQTSLPIGGENTNSVIAGHRGWAGAKYFRYVTDLAPGDEIQVTNLWETLTYKVCETQIIEPDDVEAIHIRPGRELLTLLTCHPYATGGRQRYLVICERKYDECDSRLPG